MRNLKYFAVEQFGEVVKGDVDDFGYRYQQFYNLRGGIIQENIYNKGKMFIKDVWKYDDSGNKVDRRRYNSNGSLNKDHEWKFDDVGNEIEHCFYFDGETQSKTIYKFDVDGNVIEKKWYEKSVIPEKSFSYYNDRNGNWMKKIEFFNDEPNSITIREIEYYD